MSTVFLYCAAIGGVLLALQFLMMLLGAGGDTDTGEIGGDVGHDQGAFLKLFSLQTVTTFGTFFGLVGLGTQELGWSPLAVTLAAGAAGTGALWIVANLMRSLSRLNSQGNVDLANAIGQPCSIYLRVPAAGQGQGRILVEVQGRKVECRAVSHAGELPSGSTARVIGRDTEDVLVVEPLA
jgi:hypothetical protein